MMNAEGSFIGQVCHIEGVKGERFRAEMSNEERRAFKNLMLLCYQHHVETNDEETWTVAKLIQMKADHEAHFTDPSTAMLRAYGEANEKRIAAERRWNTLLQTPLRGLEVLIALKTPVGRDWLQKILEDTTISLTNESASFIDPRRQRFCQLRRLTRTLIPK